MTHRSSAVQVKSRAHEKRIRSGVNGSALSKCTLAELITILRRGPKPDRAQTLAAITKGQPKLPKLP
jgi:hypothetical protein